MFLKDLYPFLIVYKNNFDFIYYTVYAYSKLNRSEFYVKPVSIICSSAGDSSSFACENLSYVCRSKMIVSVSNVVNEWNNVVLEVNLPESLLPLQLYGTTPL